MRMVGTYLHLPPSGILITILQVVGTVDPNDFSWCCAGGRYRYKKKTEYIMAQKYLTIKFSENLNYYFNKKDQIRYS